MTSQKLETEKASYLIHPILNLEFKFLSSAYACPTYIMHLKFSEGFLLLYLIRLGRLFPKNNINIQYSIKMHVQYIIARAFLLNIEC